MNTLQERFNLVPPCLRTDASGVDGAVATLRLDQCLWGSIGYYIELLLILVAIAAFIYLIYGGIQMATAWGNESKYAAAKNTILHAVIGIIISVLALTIVTFFVGVIDQNAANNINQTLRDNLPNTPAQNTGGVPTTPTTSGPLELALGPGLPKEISVTTGTTKITFTSPTFFEMNMTHGGNRQQRSAVPDPGTGIYSTTLDSPSAYPGAAIAFEIDQGPTYQTAIKVTP